YLSSTFSSPAAHPDRHSFPTRRSSDLFTDADCWLKPDVVARAIRSAELHEADHITLTAGINVQSLAVKAWHLLFLTSILNWISRSEEHTSELQSLTNLVCRLLLEKKNN